MWKLLFQNNVGFLPTSLIALVVKSLTPLAVSSITLSQTPCSSYKQVIILFGVVMQAVIPDQEHYYCQCPGGEEGCRSRCAEAWKSSCYQIGLLKDTWSSAACSSCT
jgi:hypothetical protein